MENDSEKYLEKLRVEVKKLLALLEDPHPGLITWYEAYAECRRKIINHWEGK